MKKEDIILRKIANTLIVYSYHIEENGLIGKTGAMFFLYLFAEHFNNQTCYNFAGDLLDGLMKSTSNAPSSFEEGLAGLGWSVGRLLRKGVVEGTPNTVLANIDKKLIDDMTRERWSENWNELIYFADRIHDRPLPVNNCNVAELVFTYIKWKIKERCHGHLPVKKHKAVRHYLKNYRAMYGKSKDYADLWKYVSQPADDNQEDRLKNNVRATTVDHGITSILWQQIFNNKEIYCRRDYNELDEYVDATQQRLSPTELSLFGGIVGLGTVLLYNQRNSNN